MKKLILLLLIPLFSFSDIGCAKIDIIILVDLSGSVKGHESYIYEAVSTFVDKTDISENGIQMGIIGFNDYLVPICDLGEDKAGLIRKAHLVESGAGGLTFMHFALEEAMNQFVTKGRTDAKKILIVISDGNPAFMDRCVERSAELKSMFDTTIFGVLIASNEKNSAFMTTISSTGCYVETHYELLAQELQKIDICL